MGWRVAGMTDERIDCGGGDCDGEEVVAGW